MKAQCRNLVLVLGDQLNADSAAFDGFDRHQDAVWMAEVAEESTHVWTHKARIVMFLSAMRHFRDALTEQGFAVHYRQIDDRGNKGTLAAELERSVARLKPRQIIVVEPGEWRVRKSLEDVCKQSKVECEIRPDRHFLCATAEFARFAMNRKQLRLEYFYREMRRKYDILMDDGTPVGGSWNFDSENRGNFGKSGPDRIPVPLGFRPDKTTQDVMRFVERRFADHPGELDNFDWPLTADDAQRALEDFVQHRLACFGDYQDAMWTDAPYLYHARISAALNLKLLDPRVAIEAAVAAFRSGAAPLNCVEGFVRQILGWREYVRGVYWMGMPQYAELNELGATQPLPDFYWSAETEMHCLRQVIQQTLEYGYAHHIQRLMVTGLFALLLGVDPKAVHEWYLAVYVDAVEWVELPNSLGMSQFADGGVMASKPYVATGKYIQRMSNYCLSCRFNPAIATGPDACPFTTLYWDFLQRHRKRLATNPRMSMQLRNLQRKSAAELREIRQQAEELRTEFSM